MKFRFEPVSVNAHIQRLQCIADQEKLRLAALLPKRAENSPAAAVLPPLCTLVC